MFRIENAPQLNNVYQLIAKYWYKGRFIDFSNELLRMCDRHAPSADEAVQLILCALHSPTFERSNMANLISKYAEIADNGNRNIGNEFTYEQLRDIDDVVLRSTLYRALPESCRPVFKKQLTDNISNLCELSLVEVRTEMHILTPALIEKFKNTIEEDLRNQFCSEELTCSILCKLAQNHDYTDVYEALSSLKMVSKCYCFMTEPTHYDRVEEIRGSWLMYLEDDELRIMIERPQIRQIVEEFCDKTLWNENFRLKVEKLLQIL